MSTTTGNTPSMSAARPAIRIRVKGRGDRGKKTVILEVADDESRDGREVYRHRINLDDALERRRYARDAATHIPNADGDTPAGVEELLAGLAGRCDEGDQCDQGDQGDTLEGEEVDNLTVARPEHFFRPEVTGITVPVTLVVNEQLSPQWRTYMHWGDGRRETQSLSARIGLPEGGTLYLSPSPGAPQSPGQTGWSRASRETWLAGGSSRGPDEVFGDLYEQIARYLDFPECEAEGTTATLALWVVLTYIYPVWDAVPYLSVLGPMGSGKSRLLDLLQRMVFRPTATSNLTGPALFRTLHCEGGTLLYDEAERLRQSTPDIAELLSVLLAGYRRGGCATRLVGDDHQTARFEVYGPKALAGIRGLPPVLASRCIPITMFRAAAGSAATAQRLDADPARWQALRDDLHVLALTYGPVWQELAQNRSVVPGTLANRGYELWQPILALARWVEGFGMTDLHRSVSSHALRTVESARDDAVPEADEMILELLASAVNQCTTPTSTDLLKEAQQRDPVTFKIWRPQTVTSLLKSYGIPTPRKTHGSRRYRVTPAALRQIGDRYGIELSLESTATGVRLNPPRGSNPPQGTSPEAPRTSAS